MTEYEKKLLRHINGEVVEGIIAGAAFNSAVEALYVSGYLMRERSSAGTRYIISPRGMEALNG